jgi:putative phosphoesterase
MIARLAVLNDIHGNLPALDAVLVEVRAASVDRIVCGGDVIVGPMSNAVLDRLSGLSVPVEYLLGNAEVAVLESLAGRAPAAVPERYRPAIVWTARQVAAYGGVIATWPKTIRFDVDGIGSVLFCHGTPRDENEIFTRLTAEERLRPLFDPLGAALVVCGHTHMQFERQVGATRIVNAGSVGMPWGRRGADWLMIDERIELRHTDYDTQAAADAVRGSGYPDADDFFVRGVSAPPPLDQMEHAYERMSLRPS